MIGRVYIERENSWGDRRIAEMIDVEGLPRGVVILDHLSARVDAALSEPGTYRARAVSENDERTIVRWRRV